MRTSKRLHFFIILYIYTYLTLTGHLIETATFAHSCNYQPIKWQQYNAQNHPDTGQELGLNIKTGGKESDLSDYGMVVGARQAGLSIYLAADLLGFITNHPVLEAETCL